MIVIVQENSMFSYVMRMSVPARDAADLEDYIRPHLGGPVAAKVAATQAPEWALHAAVEADQPAIRALVRSEKLNPNGLEWQAFMVAAAGPDVIGAAQVRQHDDGSRELGWVVVAPAHRGRGIAEGLILALLARETGPVHVVTAKGRAARFRRLGFRDIAPGAAPHRVRRNFRLGVLLGGAHSLLHGRRPVPLLILRRGPADTGTSVEQTG